MSDSNDQKTGSASRGKKTLRATGVDNSSYGETSMASLKPKMGGGRDDLSHSISDGKVATR